jgi:hypothetical protein
VKCASKLPGVLACRRRDQHVQCSFGQGPSDSCVTHEGREVTAPGLGVCELYFVWPGICAPINCRSSPSDNSDGYRLGATKYASLLRPVLLQGQPGLSGLMLHSSSIVHTTWQTQPATRRTAPVIHNGSRVKKWSIATQQDILSLAGTARVGKHVFQRWNPYKSIDYTGNESVKRVGTENSSHLPME